MANMFAVDATNGVTYMGGYLPLGWTSNLKLTVADSGFKVTGQEADLSATNPGFACVRSATSGKNVVLKFTSNPLITGANLQGRMGTTASVAWGSAMPVFFGVVNVDDTSTNARFCHSRCPLPVWSQTVTNEIGKAGTAAATSAQDNVVVWDSGATVSDYNSKNITTLGSATMTCDNSAGGVWTVGALTLNDGFGSFQEGVQFTMPLGQNGAEASNLFSSADTTPTYTTALEAIYTISVDGIMWYQVYGENTAGGTAGNGANILNAHTPYTISSDSGRYHGVGVIRNNATYYNCVASCASSNIVYLFSDSINANISPDNQGNNVRRYYATVRAPVF